MNRREFFITTSAIAATGVLPSISIAAEIPADIRITRIVGFDVTSRRPKLVGKNSRLDVHGDSATDAMVRLYTNTGIEGIGNCRKRRSELAPILGKKLVDLYDPKTRSVPILGNGTMPVWDLLGKTLGKPVYELLGGEGPERVPVYDGSIYFADLLPENAAKPFDRFKEEIDMGLKLGHRAFKAKIGRGAKWMERKEGNQRDIDVLKTIRDHAGPDIVIGVDANNGYDLEGTKRLLDDLPDFNFAFVEEMFEETVDECLLLKRFMHERDWTTLLADGETQSNLDVFKPFIEAKAIDVLQGDMNHFGFEGILTEAAWALPAGIQVAPHNWGSLVGFYMQLHVGRAIKNLYMAENDPCSNDILVAEGYEIKDGHCSVPEAAGFGLTINEPEFRSKARIRFDMSV
jgi:L-alanine-DL-glutamate epimerase-like enolase superfamily enzyme